SLRARDLRHGGRRRWGQSCTWEARAGAYPHTHSDRLGGDPARTGVDTGATVGEARVLSAMVGRRRLEDMGAPPRGVAGGPKGADGVGDVCETSLLALDQNSLSIEVYRDPAAGHGGAGRHR